MKTTLITIAFICLFSLAKGQQIDTGIYTGVEREPTPIGGMSKYLKYLQANIKYPENAVKERIEGTVVLVFVVEIDGSLTDMKVLRSVSSDLDTEAVRVVSSAPKWKPGKQHGKLLRVEYSLPVKFELPK